MLFHFPCQCDQEGKRGGKLLNLNWHCLCRKLFAVNNVWFWRCFRVWFPRFLTLGKIWWAQTLSLKSLLKRDDKDGGFIFLQSRLIKGSVSRSTTTKPCSELTLCWNTKRAIRGKQMETIEDYLHHFSRKLFEQIRSAAMTVTDGKAAGTTQLCFTFLSFCLLFFFFFLNLFCNRGLLCIEVLDNHSFGKTYCVL